MDHSKPLSTVSMSCAEDLCDDFSGPMYPILHTRSSPPTLTSFSSSPDSASFSATLSPTSFESARRASVASQFNSDVSSDIKTPCVKASPIALWPKTTAIAQLPASSWTPQDMLISPDSMMNQLVTEQNSWSTDNWHVSPPDSLYPMTPVQQQVGDYFQIDDHQASLLSAVATDPSLSRQILFDATPRSCRRSSENQNFGWHPDAWSAPETIAPQQTFHPLPTISPVPKVESSSPLTFDMINHTEQLISSSPQPFSSPCVGPSSEILDKFCDELRRSATAVRPVHARRTRYRDSRGHCRRPLPSSVPLVSTDSTNGKRKGENEAVIRQNGFACHWAGCVDKGTGKPRRFKRQEHKKRHVDTVHIKEKSFKCWVTKCEKSFPRLDNLKAHIKNTHGKNNPSQRNRYVATLDRKSQYYDPEWRGELTEDGYPVLTQAGSHRCWVPNCTKVFHVEDKLRVHLLQQHGRKISNTDISYVATLDESSGLFDPEWQGPITEDGLPAQA